MNERLGDFEVLRELGRGGMGIVYEARQISLNRKVALKVLSGGLGLTGKAVTRFKREAEAAAKLHHTNIVPIYATSEEDGTHFYAMELIEGPSLDKVIKQMRREAEVGDQRSEVGGRRSGGRTTEYGPRTCQQSGKADEFAATVTDSAQSQMPARLSISSDRANLKSQLSDSSSSLASGSGYFDTIARILAEIADGLDYAHKQGVIHRDIKPSNLLLSPDGRLHINDFGLARMLEEPGMTISGEFLGSPSYMSPEQIAAGRLPLDHRTDIYSLGVVLYELLTLQPPFTGQSRDQILAQIVQKEPKPPRSLNRKVPVDLETICLKAIEKDPDRRYQTAGAMAEDFRRYINRFAISARRASLVHRSIKWARRRPGFAVAGAMAILLLFISAGAMLQLRTAGEKLKTVERQKALDEAMLRSMSGDLTGAETAIGRAELLGASAGQTRLLRGQLALYRGLPDEAILHLREATNQLPQSVAALGILMKAAVQTGNWNIYDSLLPRLESLKPETSLDYLMLGSVLYLDPAKAIVNLDKGVELEKGSVSRLLRAEAMLDVVPMTAEIADAQKAVADAEFANSLLDNNPFALAVAARAYLWEARLHEGKNETRRREAIEAARLKADALTHFPNSPAAKNVRRDFLDYTGDEPAYEREVEEAYQQIKSSWFAEKYAIMLFGRGESSKALQAYDQTIELGPYFLGFLRPVFVADATGDLVQAAEAYANLRAGVGIWDVFFKDAHLLLLGSPQKARDEIKRNEERFRTMFPYRDGWYMHFYRFYLGEIDEAALLAQAGKSLLSLCEAHYALALTHLSQGNKAEAKRHFQAVVKTRVFQYGEYHWSRAFLKRMENDPNWPRWIPVKDPEK